MKKGRKLIVLGWLSVFGISGLNIHGMENPIAPDLPKYIVCQIGSYLDDRSASSWFTLNKRHYNFGEEYYKKIGEKEIEKIEKIPFGTFYDESRKNDDKFLSMVGRFSSLIRLIASKTKINFGYSYEVNIQFEKILSDRNNKQIKYLQQAFWLETLKPIFEQEKKLSIHFTSKISPNEGRLLIQNYGALRFLLNDLGPGYHFKTWYAIHCIYFKLHIYGNKLEHPEKYLPEFISWKKIDIDRMVKQENITDNTYKRIKKNINIFLRYFLINETPLRYFFQEMEKNSWTRYWKKKYITVSCNG